MPRADGEQPLLTENGSQIQGGGSEPFPVGRMFAILCFGFSFGELISNFGLIMLPAESGYMEPANNAIMMTFLLFISGVSQFSGPLAGYYSDRCQLNWGRRRPYLFVGTLFTIPSVIMLWVSHNMYFVKGEGDGQTGSFAVINTTDHSSLFGFKVGEHFWGEVIYITFFLVAMAAFNVQMQTLGSLISDLVPQDQTGQANGVLAVLMLTGSLMGFLVFRLLSGGFGTSLEPDGSPGFWHWLPITIPVEDTVGKMYFYYTPVIFITTCVTLLGAKEQKNPTPEHLLPPVTCKDICECFFVSPTHHRDFFIVTASRTMYACRGPAPPTVMSCAHHFRRRLQVLLRNLDNGFPAVLLPRSRTPRTCGSPLLHHCGLSPPQPLTAGGVRPSVRRDVRAGPARPRACPGLHGQDGADRRLRAGWQRPLRLPLRGGVGQVGPQAACLHGVPGHGRHLPLHGLQQGHPGEPGDAARLLLGGLQRLLCRRGLCHRDRHAARQERRRPLPRRVGGLGFRRDDPGPHHRWPGPLLPRCASPGPPFTRRLVNLPGV